MFHPFTREVTSFLRLDTDLRQRLPFTQNVIRLFVMSSLFCTTGIFSKHAVSGRLNLPLRLTRTQTGLYSSHSQLFKLLKSVQKIFCWTSRSRIPARICVKFFACKRPFSRQKKNKNQTLVYSRGRESNMKIYKNVSYSVLVKKNWRIYSFSSTFVILKHLRQELLTTECQTKTFCQHSIKFTLQQSLLTTNCGQHSF